MTLSHTSRPAFRFILAAWSLVLAVILACSHVSAGEPAGEMRAPVIKNVEIGSFIGDPDEKEIARRDILRTIKSKPGTRFDPGVWNDDNV